MSHALNNDVTVPYVLQPFVNFSTTTLKNQCDVFFSCLVPGTSIIYQPVAGVVKARGSPPPESFTAVGGREEGRREEAGLCVRVDDSAWSRPLKIAVQGAGGPFQVHSFY